MSQRRKVGVPLNIPFVDDSSGVMANGVSIGRPATPPIIRIRIPESEVYEPKIGKKVVKDQENKPPEPKSDDKNEDKDEVDFGPSKEDTSKIEDEEQDQVDDVKTNLNVPLTKRHRRNSISLPAGLDSLDIQTADGEINKISKNEIPFVETSKPQLALSNEDRPSCAII